MSLCYYLPKQIRFCASVSLLWMKNEVERFICITFHRQKHTMHAHQLECRKEKKLTKATSLSVIGLVSSPGNLIIGEGAAYVLWKARNWIKNTLRTRCRQLNIVGKPMFTWLEISWVWMPCALGCSPLSLEPPLLLLLLLSFFFYPSSLTGHPATQLYELSQFCLHMHFFQLLATMRRVGVSSLSNRGEGVRNQRQIIRWKACNFTEIGCKCTYFENTILRNTIPNKWN